MTFPLPDGNLPHGFESHPHREQPPLDITKVCWLMETQIVTPSELFGHIADLRVPLFELAGRSETSGDGAEMANVTKSTFMPGFALPSVAKAALLLLVTNSNEPKAGEVVHTKDSFPLQEVVSPRLHNLYRI